MSGTAGFHCRQSSWTSEGKGFEEGERKKHKEVLKITTIINTPLCRE